MGKRARRKQRALDQRKQPQASKREFVERKVRELEQMDEELSRVLQG